MPSNAISSTPVYADWFMYYTILPNIEVSIIVANGDGVSGAYFSERDSINFTVTLDVRELATSIAFLVSVSDGTAIQAMDYILPTFLAVFSPGSLTCTQSIVIIDDDMTEDIEFFSLNISAFFNSIAIVNGSNVQLFISIDEGEFIFSC